MSNNLEIENGGDAYQNVNTVKKSKRKKPAIFSKRWTFEIMDSTFMQSMLGILLLLSLFMPDLWILGNTDDDADPALFSILTVVLVIFCLETIILSWCQEDYFNSFFFWMDTIGTISIILDIGWISDAFMPEDTDATQKGSLLRAARAAKLGARYGRIMRLLKLMKFFRFLPCFNNEDEEEAPEPTMSAVRKVSAELSAVLSRRVAALVMLIVIVVPFLSYSVTDNATDAWMDAFELDAVNANITQDNFADSFDRFKVFYRPHDVSPISVSVESPYLPTMTTTWGQGYDVRHDNIVKYDSRYYVDNTRYDIHIRMNRTIISQWNAFFGIMLIILVIVVLFGFSASFHGAVDVLVVVPLEKMMNTLRKSATAMLKSMQAMEKEDEEDFEGGSDIDDNELETAVLEKMVEKLARIVKHVTNDNDLIVDENVDKATASWLKDNYAASSTQKKEKKVDKMLGHDEEMAKAKQLQSAHENVDPTVVNSWGFDVLRYSYDELFEYNRYLLDVFGIFQEFTVPVNVYTNFLTELSVKYIKQNTYHNFHHACDVTQTCYRIIMVSRLNTVFTELEIFSMLVAAVAHDVGHPGVNNAFLVKTRHDLAMIHNDKSPLENMHCSLLYDILKKPDMDIFSGLDDAQWRESRKIILSLILGTDMAHHFDQVSKTQLFLEVHGEDVKSFYRGAQESIECFQDDKNRIFIMELILHCSDISNPFKPFHICSQWADLVSKEFFAQGDKERENGMDISPMMDRATSNLYNMQMGFIEFVVSPLVNSTITIFPPLKEMGVLMRDNYVQWGEKRRTEILETDNGSSDEAKAMDASKMTERIGKFKEKMAFVDELVDPKRKFSSSSLLSKRSS
jgi:hypothetical protein